MVKGEGLQLEGRSAADHGWYDCEVSSRGGGLFLRFSGYGSDDEEPLTELGALRFSSLAAEPGDCPHVVPGTRITGFKRSSSEDVWVNAEVVGKKAGKHDGGKCACSFTVKWLDTADAGKQAALRIGDICLLDSRPLEEHPQYQQYSAALAKRDGGALSKAGQQARQPWRDARTYAADEPMEVADSEAGSGAQQEEAAAAAPKRPGRGQRQPAVETEKAVVIDSEEEEAEAQPPSPRPPRPFALRPPLGAAGPSCALCRLPTLLEGDPADGCSPEERLDFSGLYSNNYIVHRRCAAISSESSLNYPGRHTTQPQVTRSLMTGFQGGVGLALTQRCLACGLVGATARCSAVNCRKTFHLHCAKGCKVDLGSWEVRCPAHNVLGGIKAPGFYGAPSARDVSTRQTELERLKSGRVKPAKRLEGLRSGPGSAKRGRQGEEVVRRSDRHNGKRIKYTEGGLNLDFSEGWQRDLRKSRRDEPAESADDAESSLEEDEEGISYEDDSDETNDFAQGAGGRPRAGKRRQELTPTRRTHRERTQVKSYAEAQEELALKEEAYREAERKKTGYEDTSCEACGSKARGKEMLLCDSCDRGHHMFCLDPPLTQAPLAFWFCPGCLPSQSCETCGQGSQGAKRGSKKAAAKAFQYCPTCGALCHAGCMRDRGGDPACTLCVEGLTDVEAILGCRTPAGREDSREYFVKWKGKGYRHCRWVTDMAAARMAADKLQRFTRDTRDAASVEPNVQQQWLQVERVVATRTDPESGQRQCLVKWRGLDYDKATWEPRWDLEQEESEALQAFERRMALRVERDEAAEAQARKRVRQEAAARLPGPAATAGASPGSGDRAAAGSLVLLDAQPSFLDGVGTLKDYQLEGIGWVLGKLAAGMSVILGDEMGLGKTIQTAVFMQLARERRLTTGPVAVVVPLSTFGSWERELAKWAPSLEVLSYSGQQEARAIIRKHELGGEDDDMDAVRRKQTALKPRFHVMLTTYDVVIRDCSVLKRFDWSGVVIDEGHSLKGQDSQRGRTLRELGAPWRLLLTGTPLQNNLRELLALLAFMADCSVDEVEQHIKGMSDPRPPSCAELALVEDEELAQAQAYIRKLHAYLEPRMLRRMKASCLKGQMPPKITRKVACRMTPLQLQLYQDILAKNWAKVNALVKNKLEKKSMNNLLVRFRQICNHPYLLPGQEPEMYRLMHCPLVLQEYKEPESAAVAEEGWRLMVAASGKLALLQQLLPRLMADGHRVLIFSQSVEMLDILEDFLHDFQDTSGLLPAAEEDATRVDGASETQEREGGDEEAGGSGDGGRGSREPSEPPPGREEEEEVVAGRRGSVVRYFRLDGSTKGWQRQAMMDSFNSIDCKVKVFLISTRAGSLGINLQTANTVVLYDPDFNPFVDAQAEGRAHRLGQEETVLVYQLYTGDSVEERILGLAAKKRKLEELVTRHMGRGRDVSDEDIKSSVLHGWGNLMKQAQLDGQAGGADLALSSAELARLLDREHVFADDQATGADAAALLGEVRAGGAAGMAFEAAGERGDGQAPLPPPPADLAMEAAMLRIIQARARKYEEGQAVKEELGRGRRARGGGTANYNEEEDELRQMLSDGGEGTQDTAGRGTRSKDDAEYNPLLSSAQARVQGTGENAQPNAADVCYSSDSGASGLGTDGEGEVEPVPPLAPPGPGAALEAALAALPLPRPTPAAQPKPLAQQAAAPAKPAAAPQAALKPALQQQQLPQPPVIVRAPADKPAKPVAAAPAGQQRLSQQQQQARRERKAREKEQRRAARKKARAAAAVTAPDPAQVAAAAVTAPDPAQVAAALQLAQHPA